MGNKETGSFYNPWFYHSFVISKNELIQLVNYFKAAQTELNAF